MSFCNDNAAERDSVGNFNEALLDDARAEGYSEYRAHLIWMDLVSNQYYFNHHALRRIKEQIKNTVDPNGTLPRGESGIWSKSMRMRWTRTYGQDYEENERL